MAANTKWGIVSTGLKLSIMPENPSNEKIVHFEKK